MKSRLPKLLVLRLLARPDAFSSSGKKTTSVLCQSQSTANLLPGYCAGVYLSYLPNTRAAPG